MESPRLMRHAGTLLLAFALAAGLHARSTEVTIAVDMTDEGRKLPHPDAEHPAYYLPGLSNFMELGGSMGEREKTPPLDDIAHWAAEALARQGYVAASPKLRTNAKDELIYADGTVVTVPSFPLPGRIIRPNDGNHARALYPLTAGMIHSRSGPYSERVAAAWTGRGLSALGQVLRWSDPVHGPVLAEIPSIVLVIRWGSAYPGTASFRGGGPPLNFNLGTMLSLVAGDRFVQDLASDNAFLNKGLDWKADELVQKTRTDRFFITFAAYDFNRLVREHKRIMLWNAKMTVPSSFNATLTQMLPIMIKTGESRFGIETGPESSTVDLTPGRVIIGPLEVKYYQEATPPPRPGTKP